MSFPPPDPARDPARDAVDLAVEPAVPNPPPQHSTRPPTPVRPGDLAPAWRVMLAFGWIASFFAYAGIWQASVQIGIGTWWIGPRAQPTPIYVRLIPFVLSLVIALLIVYNVRWLVRWSAVGVAAAALISIPDFSRTIGLGVGQAIIAMLLGVITLASLSGRYRIAEAMQVPTGSVASAPHDPASR